MDIISWFNKDSNNRRSVLLKMNILASVIFKGWSAIMCFLLVPATLKCIGDYQNGIWMSIASMFVLIETMDIGLGNGLRNKLAIAIAHSEYQKAQVLVSTTFISMFLVVVPFMLLLLLAIATIDPYAIMNVDKTLVPGLKGVFSITAILFCSSFIFKFIGNVYLGMQMPAVNNLLIALSHTLTLLLTYLSLMQGAASLWVIALINTGSPLVIYLLAYPYTFFYKYKDLAPRIHLFDVQCVKELLMLGIKFFVLQFVSVLIFMLSNFIVSHEYSPAMVTPYQVTYRYFSLALTAFVIIASPYWSATTDAFECKDYEWINRQVSIVKNILIGFMVLIAFMVLISKVFFSLWIGPDFNTTIALTISMAIYMSIMLGSTAFCYFLNGLGLLRIQLINSMVSIILFLVLSFIVTQLFDGIVYIVIVLCLVALPSFVCNYIQLNKVIKGTARGFWRK